MEWLADPTAWLGLVTLVLLEIVLGIDNLVFIAILADKLPPEKRDRARLVGLGLALFMRLGLLASISWLVTLTEPLFSVRGFSFSGRDLIMFAGGLFLLTKATMELHERLEPDEESGSNKQFAGFWVVVAQIVVLDAVFSIDSVITAVGMVEHLAVMMIAVVIAIGIMMLSSKPLTNFVNRHPTVVVLCLGFLMMIGFSLVAEGFGFHIPKGYLYAAIGFSVLIEMFNQLAASSRIRQARRRPLRARTADAVFRMLGGQSQQEIALAAVAGEAGQAFGEEERSMVGGVLSLAERQVRSIMTPRTEMSWVDLQGDVASILDLLRRSPHSLYPVCRGTVDELVGYARAKDLVEDLITHGAIDEGRTVREPLVVHEMLGVLQLMDMFRRTRVQLALVTDEYGSIEGLVTPTDMLEAIAGEFPDENDEATQLVPDGKGGWIAEGWMDIRSFAFAIGREIEHDGDDYSTLAGYFLWHFGHVPKPGDRLKRDGLQFTVTEMDGRRIAHIHVEDAPEETS
ncbi:MAG: TerC family protein [Parvibaculaceae bacterium]|nr:TerC family protein [Parvibaculaceae bacterium]